MFEGCVKWNINGSVGNPSYIPYPFSATSDVGVFKVKDLRLNPVFVALQLAGQFEGFNWSNKAGIAKVRKISIRVPVDEAGSLNRDAQDKVVRYAADEKTAKNLLTKRIFELCSGNVEVPISFGKNGRIRLADDGYFRQVTTKLGSSWGMKCLMGGQSTACDSIPVYTAAKEAPVRVARDSVPLHKIIPVARDDAIFSFAADGDGSAGRNFICHKEDFLVQANRIVVKILVPELDPRYVIARLSAMKRAYGFNRAFKAKWDNVKKIPIVIPISSTGELDAKAQREWIVEYERLQRIRKSLWLWIQLHNEAGVAEMKKYSGIDGISLVRQEAKTIYGKIKL